MKLYHLHKKAIQLETLHIVQYLYSRGINLRPTVVFERNHDMRATLLPSIHDIEKNEWHIGLDACILFYEQQSGINNLVKLANEFKIEHCDFRISD